MLEKAALALAAAYLSDKMCSKTWPAVKAKLRILREASRTIPAFSADTDPLVYSSTIAGTVPIAPVANGSFHRACCLGGTCSLRLLSVIERCSQH